MRKNVLFIMCDQLRFDYLSCYGHPHIKTPHIDALAAKGVRFTNAYVQSPICGPSRMSYYTGRYVRSHGSSWNGIALRVGEPTLGDHLKEIGVRNLLLGKTHMRADDAGMQKLGIDKTSPIGVFASQCGFEALERDDGLHPDGSYDPNPRYNQYLREQGFTGNNPWQEWANSAEDAEGKLLSGWLMENADKPARIPDYYSETPYLTRRAMAFMDNQGDDPWCLHLSYIKPHWPYMAPAPYHNMYNADHVQPPIRSEAEKTEGHPVFKGYMDHLVSQSFSKDEVRERVIPTYMGLIKQIDDQMGILFQHMQDKGLMDNTLIVFTADHGDYLGDHWMGEKELFHEASVKVPLIIYDPEQVTENQQHTTAGSVCDELVESIDLAPTFIEFFGGEVKENILEGRSLLPLLRGTQKSKLREFLFSEYDYSARDASVALNVPIADARLVMVRDERWKFIYVQGMRPMLFDLQNDPNELQDLGAEPSLETVRARMQDAILQWSLQHHNRITKTDAQIAAGRDKELSAGIIIGYWSEEELAAAVANEQAE